MRGLHNKTAIVTGSGRGIGQAIARRLGDEGAFVVINDTSFESATDTLQLIEEDGGNGMTEIADVSDYDAVDQLVTHVIDTQGNIDVLINNAGWDWLEWFVRQEPKDWDKIININFRGQVNCSHVVAKSMIEHDIEGTILNIASDAGRVGSSGEAVYAGTKGGIIAFTKTLARELARYNINCNVLAPGPTDTPLFRKMKAENELASKIFANMEDHIPLDRLAEPDDIAGGAAFLVSTDAEYITGQVLSISGGLTMVD